MKAKRVLIIYRVDLAKVEHQGIAQKLQGQAAGFRKLGYDVDTISIQNDTIVVNDSIQHKNNGGYTYFQFRFFDKLCYSVNHDLYDICLIRYGLSTPGFIKFIKKFREDRPLVKVVIEMPTYPYENEWSGFRGRLVIGIDQYYSKCLRRYVDFMIHSGTESCLFDISTIQMSNGIDVESVPIKKEAKDDSSIQMIAVGKWQKWHGLDRLLRGLADYSSMVKPQLHIVGNGPELGKLKALSVELKIKSRVHFHGPLIGSPLDEIYDCCHVAIGTLGIHRKGVTINSSLKHRSYCARGIPFVLSSTDSDFDPQLSFVHYVPANDQSINVIDLVEFYNGFDHHPKEIRSFAERTLGWDDKIRDVVDRIY